MKNKEILKKQKDLLNEIEQLAVKCDKNSIIKNSTSLRMHTR